MPSSSKPPIRFVHSGDHGTDDVIGSLAAIGHPRLELLAIAAAGGNVPRDNATKNALKAANLDGASVPVYPGADRPYNRLDMPVPWAVLNAANPGFQIMDMPLPETTVKAQDMTADDYLIAAFMLPENPPDALVVTGPLTDLALALDNKPQLTTRIKHLVIMGGSVLEPGNVEPLSEFNIWAAPEAADRVLTAGFPKVTIVPLDATHAVPLTYEDCAKIRGLGTLRARYTADLIAHRIEQEQGTYPDREPSAPVHDPIAIAALVYPDILRDVRSCHVRVETTGKFTVGQLVVDRRSFSKAAPNARVALSADPDLYWQFLLEALGPQ